MYLFASSFRNFDRALFNKTFQFIYTIFYFKRYHIQCRNEQKENIAH